MSKDNLTLNDLADMIANMKTDISQDMSKQISNLQVNLETKFFNAIGDVKKDIDTINNRQDILEEKYDKIERQLHLTDLLIHGIPKNPNEDLRSLMQSVSSKIGFSSLEYSLLSVFRINHKSSKPTIILKFISLPARNEFYKLYKDILQTKPICLNHIGFNSNDRIIIQESLSTSNSTIFKKAMEYKKENKLYSVFTQNGFVKIKPSADSKAITIINLAQLLQMELQSNKTVQHKRKFNSSSHSDKSFIEENDPKILKSSIINISALNSTFKENIDSMSINSSSNSSTVTLVDKNLNRDEMPHRKTSTGTLDEFLIRN